MQRIRGRSWTGTPLKMISRCAAGILALVACSDAFSLQSITLQNKPESPAMVSNARLLRQSRLRHALAQKRSRSMMDLRRLKATAEDVRETRGVKNDVATAPRPSTDEEAEWPYDWRKHWYPVSFDTDIAKGPKPFGVSIFDEPLMLFRDTSGALQCVSDFCPHRASKLSEGQITQEGMIECLYHGWQFDGSNGNCIKIPQLPQDASIPQAARLRVYPVAVSEGMVFVWMGDDPWGDGAKDILPVPSTGQNLDENKRTSIISNALMWSSFPVASETPSNNTLRRLFLEMARYCCPPRVKPDFVNEFVYDLPYDWSYLVENLLDPAHICISHDATSGGGSKDKAGPIDFEVVREGTNAPSPQGFVSLVTMDSFGREKKKSTTRYTFEAPGILRQRSEGKKEGEFSFGAALHCIPLGKGRSRLLFKVFSMNIPPVLKFILKLKPKVLRNLNSCKILEQDVKLVCAQEDHVARTGQPLAQAFLPIKTSDALVVELRKWLDHVGHGMPYFTGWKKRKEPAHLSDHEDSRLHDHRSNVSRYHRHVLISTETRRALAAVKRVKKVGLTLAAALATGSMLLVGPGAGMGTAAMSRIRATSLAALCGAVCSLSFGVAALVFEGHFYRNFERHPALE